jgi:hypothetical protein
MHAVLDVSLRKICCNREWQWVLIFNNLGLLHYNIYLPAFYDLLYSHRVQEKLVFSLSKFYFWDRRNRFSMATSFLGFHSLFYAEYFDHRRVLGFCLYTWNKTPILELLGSHSSTNCKRHRLYFKFDCCWAQPSNLVYRSNTLVWAYQLYLHSLHLLSTNLSLCDLGYLVVSHSRNIWGRNSVCYSPYNSLVDNMAEALGNIWKFCKERNKKWGNFTHYLLNLIYD